MEPNKNRRLPLIAFVVNGDSTSAMGQRASEFAQRLRARFAIQCLFREGGRGRAAATFFRRLKRLHPSLVCVFDHAIDGVLAAVFYNKWGRIPWVLDTGDDISALGEALGRRGLSLWTTHWLDRLGTSQASHIVVRGRGHQELLAKRKIQCTWIPDGFNLESFQTSEQDFPPNPSLDYPLTIGVLGSSVWSDKKQMCYGQDLIQVVHKLQSGAKLDFPVRGVMIGDGSGLPHLRSLVEKFGLSNEIEFLGRRSAEDIPAIVSTWHVALSTQTNDRVGAVRTTGKLPIYLACGRFVIASRVGEAARILPNEMLVDYEGENDPTYPKKAADRIAELVQRDTDFVYCRESRKLAGEFFDYDKLASEYRVVFENLLRQSPRAPS